MVEEPTGPGSLDPRAAVVKKRTKFAQISVHTKYAFGKPAR